jgi:hypothetical protein
MGKSRVVIGAVNVQQQYETILRLKSQPDIEIIGPISDALELLMTVGETNADAVILPLEEDGGDPGLCSHLMAEYPGVLLFAISATGQQMFQFEISLSKRELVDGDDAALNAIRLATAPR